MAKADVSTRTVTVQRPVEVEEQVVTLTLNNDEAGLLLTLVGKCNAVGEFKEAAELYNVLSSTPHLTQYKVSSRRDPSKTLSITVEKF